MKTIKELAKQNDLVKVITPMTTTFYKTEGDVLLGGEEGRNFSEIEEVPTFQNAEIFVKNGAEWTKTLAKEVSI